MNELEKKLTREFLFEKCPKPSFEERSDGRILQHWYNEKGQAHRDNNLPAVIVQLPDKTLCHYHKNGRQYKTVVYNKEGKRIKPSLVIPDGWYMDNNHLGM
jgi:hypothetical protein